MENLTYRPSSPISQAYVDASKLTPIAGPYPGRASSIMTTSTTESSSAEVTVHVGVDVGSLHLDIAIQGKAGVRRLANTDAAISRWLKDVPTGSLVAMESTGRYHRRLAELAHVAGMVVFVLDPRAVHHYARGMGQRGKTDRLDAQLLARLIEREHARLRPWQPPSDLEVKLSELIRQRASITQAKSSLSQGLHPEAAAAVDFTPLFKQFDATLRALDKEIVAVARALPEGKAALASVMSVPGIGLLTGATLLPVFQRLSKRGSDAVVAFFGMDPRPSESGKHVGLRRLSKHGDAYARKLLYTAAMSAVRTSEVWRAYFEHQRAKGLPTTAALVIVGRKLLRIAFALFKSNSTYEQAKVAPH